MEGGWKVTSSVNAIEKLSKYNRNVRAGKEDALMEKEKAPKLATMTLVAPYLVYQGQRSEDPDGPPPSIVMSFWICPTGTGRSRFMSAITVKTPTTLPLWLVDIKSNKFVEEDTYLGTSRSRFNFAPIVKIPFHLPRWLVHINTNTFLDQDHYILWGQHRALLKREAEGYLRDEGDGGRSNNNVRGSTYVSHSPSEKLPVRVGQFFDSTLERAPNRKEGVLAWYRKNVDGGKLLGPWPRREEMLDRYEQHTKLCQDSKDVVDRCNQIMASSKSVALALTFMKTVWEDTAAPTMALSNPFASGVTLAACNTLLSESVFLVCGVVNHVEAYLIEDRLFYSILVAAFLTYSLASKVKREFFFKYDDDLQREDTKAIVNNWIDL